MIKFEIPKTKVCVKLDNNNTIVEITSDTALLSLDGYTVIDKGYGDKYNYAAQLYLDKGLVDSEGVYNYKIIDGEILELTSIEKEKYKER